MVHDIRCEGTAPQADFFKFQKCSNVFGTPSAPTHMILQSQTTFWAVAKLRYTKHILQMLMT